MRRDKKSHQKRAKREAHKTAGKLHVERVRIRAPVPMGAVSATVRDCVKKQLARFRAHFNRMPAIGEPIFFDARADAGTPVKLEPDDAEGIAETARALEMPVELVGSLVRAGLLTSSIKEKA